jgi:hypothetical protein
MLQRLVQQVEPAGDSVNSAAEAMLQRLVEEFVSDKKSPTLPLTQKGESTKKGHIECLQGGSLTDETPRLTHDRSQ